MGLWEYLKTWNQDIVNSRDRDKRISKIKDSCGCVCFCPECNEPLNDDSNCETIDSDGIYRYTCAQCGKDSVFHFGIAPVPIYLEDYNKTENR